VQQNCERPDDAQAGESCKGVGMREDRKKRQEVTYLRRFRENFSGFPDGTVLPNEHPDFLVETR